VKFQDWQHMSKKRKLIPELRFPEFQNQGEWEYKYGDELFETISNKNHKSDLPILAITQEQGAIPRDLIDYNVSVTDKSIESYKVVDVGDFIISLRSFQGGIEYSTYLGLCSPAYIVLRKKVDIINDFYRHYFKSFSFIQDLNRNLEGIRDGKMISYSQFSQILIPRPSKKEQQKIAGCLSSLDELIATHSQKLELLKKHKKGLMQNLFPKEGEKVPKFRFKEFVKHSVWRKTTIEKLAKVTTGGTPKSTNSKYWNGDIPWMNSGELNSKRIYSVSNFITSKGLKESNTKLIPPKCVLIGLAGQGKTRGTAAINYIKLCTNQSIGSIHPNEDMFDSEFLYQKIDSMYDKLRFLSAGDGGRGGLNLQIIKEIELSLPEMKEQQKIASCLSSLDELIMAQAEKIEQLKLHKKGLIQGLFPKTND
jgi:type I restriction enzyme, S subunit